MRINLEDLNDTNRNWVLENPVLLSYLKRGFFKAQHDMDYLHLAYSPYRVPRGLTELQIRRKINKFVKNGKQVDSSLLRANRLTILFNGEQILGADITVKKPENRREMNKMLRDLLMVTSGPRRPLPKGF